MPLPVTSSGFAAVSDVTGGAEARSEYGDVSVQGAAGDVVTRRASGHATVVADPDAEPVALRIRTSSGRTTVKALTDPGARRSRSSGYGDVAYPPTRRPVHAGTLVERTTSSGRNTTWSRTGFPSLSRDSSRSAAR